MTATPADASRFPPSPTNERTTRRPVQRLNHAVLFVSDLDRSLAFHRDVLGFRPLPGAFPGAVFLQAAGSANDHDLGLFQSPAPGSCAGRGRVGLCHLAWEVDTLAELKAMRTRLTGAGASDHATTKALSPTAAR